MVFAGMNETGTASGFTVAASDDIHSWWRPAKVSTATALTRSAIWYTANTARQAGYVYVAPSGAFDALTVLVAEISGLGPWDVVTRAASAYAAAATSLSLSLSAPAAASAVFAMIAGDSTAAGQAFAPGGWTALSSVTITNGTDHTCDSVLNAAYLPSASGTVSVSGSAVSAADLSGVIIELQIAAPSPVPAGANPNWPYLRCEAAFGGGFQTPPDGQVWTDITSRVWAWDETTGVQYQLNQLQATNVELEADNFDGALSSDNTGSPYYSNALNQNMSFQSGISPWLTYFSTLAQSSAHVFASAPIGNPQFSLQVTPGGGSVAGAESEFVAVAASAAYTAISVAVLCRRMGGRLAGGIFWYDSTHAFISGSGGTSIPLAAAAWTQVTVTGTAPSNAAYAQILIQQGDSRRGVLRRRSCHRQRVSASGNRAGDHRAAGPDPRRDRHHRRRRREPVVRDQPQHPGMAAADQRDPPPLLPRDRHRHLVRAVHDRPDRIPRRDPPG